MKIFITGIAGFLGANLAEYYLKKNFKVLLSGDGGDEIFSGYSRYIFANNSFNLLTKGPPILRKNLSNFLVIKIMC